MGSPGVFIHSGAFGGRLSVSAAPASLAPSAPATAAPPIMPVSRRKRRRDFRAESRSASVDWVIYDLRSKRRAPQYLNLAIPQKRAELFGTRGYLKPQF